MLVLGLVDLPWWAILLLLLVALYLYETRNFNFFKDQGIPFIKPFPLIGTMYKYQNMREGDMEVLREYKDHGMAGGFLRDRPVLVLWEEKLMADVLVKEANNFINHMAFADPGGLSSKMLFNMNDGKWKTTRNEMTPTFSTGKLKQMNHEIDRCAQALGEYLLEQAEIGEPIQVKEYIGGFTMDVIASTAFGIRLNSVKERDNAFVTNARNLMTANLNAPTLVCSMLFPGLTSFLRKFGFSFDPMEKEPLAFFSNVTKQALEIRKADNDQSRTDFLQIAVNAQQGEGGEDQDEKTSTELKDTQYNQFYHTVEKLKQTWTTHKLSDVTIDPKTHQECLLNTLFYSKIELVVLGLTTDEIVANAINFFQAGYDTTANTLSFLMYSLATNPDIQTRLIEEIDRVVLDKECVPYSVLQDLPYLEQCLSETLRLYPIALITNRVAKKDITLQGVFFKKDMAINIPIFALQRHPERWPDPERFDPERFSPENKGKRNPYHYIPFGAGPRMCIGNRLALQQMKMAIIHILKRVTVETCEKTEIPITFENTFLLKPNDLWLKTVKR